MGSIFKTFYFEMISNLKLQMLNPLSTNLTTFSYLPCLLNAALLSFCVSVCVCVYPHTRKNIDILALNHVTVAACLMSYSVIHQCVFPKNRVSYIITVQLSNSRNLTLNLRIFI